MRRSGAFIDLLHHYWASFDGKQMRSLWNEMTGTGQETEDFGCDFREKICDKYEFKPVKFSSIRNVITSRYSESLSAGSGS